MKDWNEYKTTLVYPKKSAFTTTIYYKNGAAVAVEPRGVKIPLGDLPEFAAKETLFAEDEYKRAKDEYDNDVKAKMDQFKLDMFYELDIEDNPKRYKLFNKAWDIGHSSGFQEVFYAAQDLVELIKND